VYSLYHRLAAEVMAEEMHESPEKVFVDFNVGTAPIAAASLGQVRKRDDSMTAKLRDFCGYGKSPMLVDSQVYKLRLKEDGAEVAVKVQRPDMLEGIVRDIYILRNIATIVEKVSKYRYV
jgi:predicted unusual protein kinase regulating ubiquinone biosynthesis (AarF/ABC1/UbiB family)